MTVPTRGFCHSVFLLTYAANIRSCTTFDDWINTAKGLPTVMTAQLDLRSDAEQLQTIGLAEMTEDRIVIDQRLVDAGVAANDDTLIGIAKVLLAGDTPRWLATAVSDDVLRWELVPDHDSDDLAWIGNSLGPVLIGLHHQNRSSEAFRLWLGQLGENCVVSSEIEKGRTVNHVSLISDYFGYDVESSDGESQTFIEVKTTMATRPDTFFITKNETRKAAQFESQWKLVQIVIDHNAITKDVVTANDVKTARTLRPETMLSLIPTDTDTGEWIDSAKVTAPQSAWIPEDLQIPSTWRFKGYRT